jgi:hypothetical protein
MRNRIVYAEIHSPIFSILYHLSQVSDINSIHMQLKTIEKYTKGRLLKRPAFGSYKVKLLSA